MQFLKDYYQGGGAIRYTQTFFYMLDFIEPAQSPLLITLAQSLWPLYIRARFGGLRLEVSSEVLEAFKRLKGEAVIICPNHSAYRDPDVIFGLSRLAGKRFYYLTAREVFGGKKTFNAFWLQKLGCLSVERGLADIESFKATRELLINGEKVVIFPEGEISHQNSHLMELENGAEHIALSALKELEEMKQSRRIYILPLALKYRYDKDMTTELEAAMTEIEKVLGSCAGDGETLAHRIQWGFKQLVVGLHATEPSIDREFSLDKELWDLRERLILEGEAHLHVRLDRTLSQLQRIHILKSKFSQVRWRGQNKHDFQESRICYRRLKLASALSAIGEHSFDHMLSAEEAGELLGVLEEAVTGKSSIRQPEIVTVGAGRVIDVKEFMPAFHNEKKGAVEALKLELKMQLATRLEKLEHLHSQEPVI